MRFISLALFCSLYFALCLSDEAFKCEQREDPQGEKYWPMPCEDPNNIDFKNFMEEMEKYLFGPDPRNPNPDPPSENFKNSRILYNNFLNCTIEVQYTSDTDTEFRDRLAELRKEMKKHVEDRTFKDEQFGPCP